MRGVGIAIIAGLCIAAYTPARDAHIGASFIDRFERLDPERWLISDGWRNAEWQECVFSSANVDFVGNALRLRIDTAGSGDHGHACAEIQTRAFYGYGAYEVRMRAARNPGIVSAFFTYTGPQQGDPHDEIDFEFLGRDSMQVQLNHFARGDAGGAKLIPLGFDASQEMADYAFVWRFDSIKWYVNGQLVHERRDDGRAAFPLHPSKIVLSVWSGIGVDDWLGRFAYPGTPLIASYEHVAFTGLQEPCQFAGSIVCVLEKSGQW